MMHHSRSRCVRPALLSRQTDQLAGCPGSLTEPIGDECRLKAAGSCAALLAGASAEHRLGSRRHAALAAAAAEAAPSAAAPTAPDAHASGAWNAHTVKQRNLAGLVDGQVALL